MTLPDRDTIREALGDWADIMPTEGGLSDEHSSGLPSVRVAYVSPDGFADERDPIVLDEPGIQRLLLFAQVARAYVDGTWPDYEAAARALYESYAGPNPDPPWEEIKAGNWDNGMWSKEAKIAVDAALGRED